ncbi:hypothetical protein B0H14DRAFT_3901111 [Mycena olivaceomarginata]|nr:hypothetical protein B0H14DRAFT_3901111 [Mycena olivaceomarginata]
MGLNSRLVRCAANVSWRWGTVPASRLRRLDIPDVSPVSSWGSNTWLYNGQYSIPGYLLFADGVPQPRLGAVSAPREGKGEKAITYSRPILRLRRTISHTRRSTSLVSIALGPQANARLRRRDTRRDTRSDAFNSFALPPSPNTHASSTITTGSRPVSPPTSNARPALRTSSRPALRTPTPALPAHSNVRPPISNARPPTSNTHTPTSNAHRPALRTPVAPHFELPPPPL